MLESLALLKVRGRARLEPSSLTEVYAYEYAFYCNRRPQLYCTCSFQF